MNRDLNQNFNHFVRRHEKMVINYPVRSIRENCEKYLVIVEPRQHENFNFVCRTMLRFTNFEWGLHVFHGTKNENFVKLELMDIDNVKYTNINVDNLTIEDYNHLMTSPWFYEQIQSNKFLIFQTDSCLLKEGIDDYVEYDYVGAPWPHRRNKVGNGGLSIRDKNKCIEVCKKYNRLVNQNEDVFFSTYLPSINAKIPDFQKACSFSCELIPTTVLPIGVHKFIQNVKVENLDTLFKNQFEIKNTT